MADSYGFGKAKAPVVRKENDFSDLPKGPISVSETDEARALSAGEKLGFISREAIPSLDAGRIVRRNRKAVPSSQLFIKGPTEIIDWFTEYANQGGFKSYWEALDDLRKRAGR